MAKATDRYACGSSEAWLSLVSGFSSVISPYPLSLLASKDEDPKISHFELRSDGNVTFKSLLLIFHYEPHLKRASRH